jgi:hypothetical protein
VAKQRRGRRVRGRKGRTRSTRTREIRRVTALTKGPGSLGEWLQFIGAAPDDPDWLPVWPPDAFAIGAALLKRTGAYVNLVNGTHSRKHGLADGSPEASKAGKEWRETLELVLAGTGGTRLRDACPAQIKRWWQQIARESACPLDRCATNSSVVAGAVNLCIASDEASAGLGVTADVDRFLAVAESVLESNERRSFCLHISSSKMAVLGKQHTPQRGCTIRSLTHNLSLYSPAEIHARWDGPYHAASNDLDVFNLLLLPWPTEVRAGDFRVSPRHAGMGGGAGGPRVHRYFDYAPQVREPPKALAARVADALDLATRQADEIHGIVFPELALTYEQYKAVEQVAVRRRAILIAGVAEKASAGTNELPVNACAIQPFGLTAGPDATTTRDLSKVLELMRRRQFKHHRWCLDRNQILQYELGGRLPASYDCWERIFIGERSINFVTLADWLTVCVLICEDLARQDPVTEIIRAIGPNLVVALLMDGPQLRDRWPSRYASVLAEDPGSSVLSLTSIGMAKRSRPKDGMPDRSDTIALWRDVAFGEKEISLAPGHDACVLSLVRKVEEEYTIDGRGDAQRAFFPVFAGSFSFACDEARKSGRRV